MRISDWSSTCALPIYLVELEDLLPQLGPAVQQRQIGDSLGKAADKLKDSDKLICRLAAVLEIARETDFDADSAPAADRKSVVSGKSVSARVDLGGRRVIKKNKGQRRPHHISTSAGTDEMRNAHTTVRAHQNKHGRRRL